MKRLMEIITLFFISILFYVLGFLLNSHVLAISTELLGSSITVLGYVLLAKNFKLSKFISTVLLFLVAISVYVSGNYFGIAHMVRISTEIIGATAFLIGIWIIDALDGD